MDSGTGARTLPSAAVSGGGCGCGRGGELCGGVFAVHRAWCNVRVGRGEGVPGRQAEGRQAAGVRPTTARIPRSGNCGGASDAAGVGVVGAVSPNISCNRVAPPLVARKRPRAEAWVRSSLRPAREAGRASPWPPSQAHARKSRAAATAASLGGAGRAAGRRAPHCALELGAEGPELRRERSKTERIWGLPDPSALSSANLQPLSSPSHDREDHEVMTPRATKS